MRRRAQSNLVAVVVALVLVTAAIGVALAVAGTPFAEPGPSSVDRTVAADVADAILAPGSPLTRRAAVLDRSALEGLDGETLRTVAGLPADAAVSVAFAGESLVSSGAVTDGATVRRVVTVTTWEWRRLRPAFTNNSTVSLPATPRVRITFNGSGATVETVRVDGRVVLHDPDGLTGTVTLSLPRTDGVTLSFVATESLTAGDVRLAVPTVETETGVLVVTVDA